MTVADRAPDLVLAWGNPSRGDDALGPALLRELARHGRPGVELVEDFQLQIEHCLDLDGRHRVLFVDAGVHACAPFEARALDAAPAADAGLSHALPPQQLLRLWMQLHPGLTPPRCTLLAIRGESFGLGEPMSAAAHAHLRAALAWVEQHWLPVDASVRAG